MKLRVRLALCAVSVLCVASEARAQRLHTENVILLMTDGLRWQEVFSGADEALMNKEHGNVGNLPELKARYWRDSVEERRALLLPFLWGVVAKEGQIIGNQAKGSVAEVTNGLNFSYPGYNETLVGWVDPGVDSNRKIPNSNVTVFEWLHHKEKYKGHVAAFGAWDVFPSIFNRERCGFLVNAGYEPLELGAPTATMALLNRLKRETIRYWAGEPFDSLTFETALEYFTTHRPHVFYLSLGETDEWAHEGSYDHYLESARNFDDFTRVLWETAQSMPHYKGKTTLLITTDHGRGDAPEEWKGHGKDIKGAEDIWVAALGPDTAAKGEWSGGPRVTQSQIAATVAAFLGEDYPAAVSQAAKPIMELIGR